MKAFRIEPSSWRVHVTLAVFTITAIGAMVFVLNTVRRMSTTHTPLLDAAMGIRLSATTAHLWFEEILSGDRNENLEEVWALLGQADRYAQAMLEGDRDDRGRVVVLDDPRMRQDIREVRNRLDDFQEITRERWMARNTSAAGTDIDQRYDRVFKELIVAAADVGSRIQQNISDDNRRLQRVQLSLIGATIGLAILGGAVFSKYSNDRSRAEAALKQGEEELRITFENTPTAVAVLDMDTVFLRVNRALCSLLGCADLELTGRRYRNIVHPDDAADVAVFFRQFLDGDTSIEQIEHRYLGPEKALRHGLLHVGRIPATSTHPPRLVAQVIDLTDQVLAEEEAREHRERLAHVTRLSTMGEMAAGIAHEINQPLTAIAASAQACERLIVSGRLDPEEQLEALRQISGSALRAGDVIRRLRALARKDKRQRDLADINEILRGIITLAEAHARVRDVRIRLRLGADLPPVIVDRVQIEQVVLNLVRNGIEATRESGDRSETLAVGTRRLDTGEVEITVTDAGIGISEDVERTLFTPFQTTKEGGMGVGLSMSRSIVTSHGGRLWFTRNKERGTTFHVSLPPAPESRA